MIEIEKQHLTILYVHIHAHIKHTTKQKKAVLVTLLSKINYVKIIYDKI